MSAPETGPSGPDFANGVPAKDIPPGTTLAGRCGDDSILVSRIGDAWFAIGGTCTHYGGPLAEGLCHGGGVRCPWHHARFDLRTGEALEAPAIDALTRWKVEAESDLIYVRERLAEGARAAVSIPDAPKKIVIVGGGAAGFAAAEMLRRRGYAGALTMLSADHAPPCDRPNLSKDYLVGTAPAEWMPLKSEEFYKEHLIDLRLDAEVRAIDVQAREVVLASRQKVSFGRLLLATGAEPIRLPTPGFDLPNAYILRSMADADALIAAAKTARRVAVIGASFIGLEAAAALRKRGLDVHVIAPEDVPMKKVLGAELGQRVREEHEKQGVRFHLGRTAQGFDGKRVVLAGGEEILVDMIVLGVGVRPRTQLAQAAGLIVDNGVIVDEFMRTSAEDVFAAGDIARYRDTQSGQQIRVEHWVVAERQGQIAAANMLGERLAYRTAPYFWSKHYDLAIRYVGHSTAWDALTIDGSLAADDATVRYLEKGRTAAAASIGRNLENLEIEAELEERV